VQEGVGEKTWPAKDETIANRGAQKRESLQRPELVCCCESATTAGPQNALHHDARAREELTLAYS
jgi:hypothetical protein